MTINNDVVDPIVGLKQSLTLDTLAATEEISDRQILLLRKTVPVHNQQMIKFVLQTIKQFSWKNHVQQIQGMK